MTRYLKYPVNFRLPQLKGEEGFVQVLPLTTNPKLQTTSNFRFPLSKSHFPADLRRS